MGPGHRRTSLYGRPSSSSSTAIARPLSNEGTLSHRRCSSVIAPGDKMSGRMDSASVACGGQGTRMCVRACMHACVCVLFGGRGWA